MAARGWSVRALTRKPDGKPAKQLVDDLGVEVVRADMEDPASLRKAFDGVDAVYCVQNGLKAGFERELAQGRNVAEAAADQEVSHVVYGSAGPGSTTRVRSWDVKLQVTERMEELGLPVTVLRPTAFMELMTDKALYPSLGTWNIWPKIMGEDRPVPWLCVADLGEIAAAVFADPEKFVGKDLGLASDVRTLAECRSIYREVMGKEPTSVPMPQWLFDRFTRKDLTTMWRWSRTHPVPLDIQPTWEILPSAKTVRGWLTEQRDASSS